MKNIKSFEQFLNYIKSQKEISLGIAQDQNEIKKWEKVLGKNSFKKVASINELFKTGEKKYKNYLLIEDFQDQDGELKNIYDFLIQYPTGQIEIFDKELMQANTMTPDYTKSALLFLTTKESATKIKEKGYDLLSHVGLTYQT